MPSGGTTRPTPALRHDKSPANRGLSERVSEGTRTPDRLDHNQELYQLSYAHREETQSSNGGGCAGSCAERERGLSSPVICRIRAVIAPVCTG
jgi:hypothetical protein